MGIYYSGRKLKDLEGGCYMYLFSVRALQKKIISNQLTEKSKFVVYFIVTIFLMILTLFPRNTHNNDELAGITNIIFLLLSSVGLIACYRINAKQDNKNFIERITLVTLPLNLQTFFIAIISQIIYMLILIFSYHMSLNQIISINGTTLYQLIMVQLLALYYYIRSYFFIKKVSRVIDNT